MRATALLVALAGHSPAALAQEACRVAEAQIQELMALEHAKGYDLLMTSNGVRLQSAVIVGLVRAFRAADPERRPLWIDHERYFRAFLRTASVTPERAPAFIRAAYEHGESVLVDYRDERVIAAVDRGAAPELAINVKAGWSGPPSAYTYEDRDAEPPLRVTHRAVNAYRVLVSGDVVVYDAIEGIYGRATGGVLGAMFRVIGDGRAVRTRFVVSDDGVQVTRTTARKGPIEITQTATVFPDGRADRGVPRQRKDLEALEDTLREPLDVRYRPLDTSGMPAAPAEDCGCAAPGCAPQ